MATLNEQLLRMKLPKGLSMQEELVKLLQKIKKLQVKRDRYYGEQVKKSRAYQEIKDKLTPKQEQKGTT